MKTTNIPLLPAITKRAKDAARAVKQGVFIILTMVETGILTKLLDLPQFEVTGYGIERNAEQDIVHIYGKIAIEVAICPTCHTLTETIKEHKARCVRDCDVWGKRTFLHFETRRFECEACGHRFTEELQAIGWRRRQTKRFEQQVYQGCLKMSKNKVAQHFHLNDSTVRGIFKRWAKQARQGKQFGIVRVLGIDEISLKKRHKQFAVVISDLERHCVLAVLPDRKIATLKKWVPPCLTNSAPPSERFRWTCGDRIVIFVNRACPKRDALLTVFMSCSS